MKTVLAKAKAVRPFAEKMITLGKPVEMDGGFVHSSERRSKTDGGFEVITGQSMTGEGVAKCFRLRQPL